MPVGLPYGGRTKVGVKPGFCCFALAKAASVGVSTVRDFEAGRRDPTRNNLAAMRAALETGGIAFVDDIEAPGITARR